MFDLQTPVAQVVLEHPETAAVFQRHRIDFCCRGEAALQAACQERKLDPASVKAELEAAVSARRGGEAPDARSLSTTALLQHIVSRHHAYLREALPLVQRLAVKVSRVHGEHNTRLPELEQAVLDLVAELDPHLDDEEQVLFPALQTAAPDRTVINPRLAAMQAEHRTVGATLERIRTAAEDFAVPEWACNSYRTLFAELESLEGDVLKHVHLENHVLLPRFQPEP